MSNPKIIAVDFDGCLVTNCFPDIGEPIPETIAALKHEQENGAKVILWTCRVGEHEAAAEEWCTEQGIHLNAVNDNLQEMKEFFGNDTRKVFANEYWDDRARLMPQETPDTSMLTEDELECFVRCEKCIHGGWTDDVTAHCNKWRAKDNPMCVGYLGYCGAGEKGEMLELQQLREEQAE